MQRRQLIHQHYHRRIAPERASYDVLDWASEESQQARFAVLARVLRELGEADAPFPPLRLLDAGCGLCDLCTYLHEERIDVTYVGADITPGMLGEARRRHELVPLVLTDLFVAPPFRPRTFDVVFASGVFNLKLGNIEKFVRRAIPVLFGLANRCVVANFLHVRTPHKHEHCHYFSPERLVADIQAGLGCEIRLVADYLENDFTLVLRR
jgi:SAM-dependent methyltransferase